MTGDGANLPTIVLRGLRRRCPACGKGPLFRGFVGAIDACEKCGFDFRDPAGDTWAILYLTTGAITGMGIVVLLLFRPQNPQAARYLLIPIVALIFGATVPIRRGFAIGVHFWMRRVFGEL